MTCVGIVSHITECEVCYLNNINLKHILYIHMHHFCLFKRAPTKKRAVFNGVFGELAVDETYHTYPSFIYSG